MDVNVDLMARRLVDLRLQVQPETRRLYQANAEFRASVELMRNTMAVVAEATLLSGVGYAKTEEIIQVALGRLLNDRELQAARVQQAHAVRYVIRGLPDQL